MRTSDRPLSADDARQLLLHVAELAQAGLPLAGGLRAAADETSDRRLAHGFNTLAGQLELGVPLDVALGAPGLAIPLCFRRLILIGTSAGQLGEVLQGFVRHERRRADLRSQLLARLSYPLLLLAVIMVIVPVFALLAAAPVAELAAEYGRELPLQTKLLIAVAGFGWWGPAAVLALLGAVAVGAWLLRGWRVTQAIGAALPLLGPMWQWAGLAEFCRLLALLVERGVPLDEALDLVADALGNRYLSDGARRLAREVAAGLPPADSVAALPHFPPLLASLVAWGAQGRALGEALDAAAELFQSRAEQQLGIIRVIAPPAVFLLVVGAMLVLYSASMVPLVDLIETLT